MQRQGKGVDKRPRKRGCPRREKAYNERSYGRRNKTGRPRRQRERGGNSVIVRSRRVPMGVPVETFLKGVTSPFSPR